MGKQAKKERRLARMQMTPSHGNVVNLYSTARFGLLRTSVTIVGLILSAVVSGFLLLVFGGYWFILGFLVMAPCLDRYIKLLKLEKKGPVKYISDNPGSIVKTNLAQKTQTLRCSSCGSQEFSKWPAEGVPMVNSVSCSSCSKFLYYSGN